MNQFLLVAAGVLLAPVAFADEPSPFEQHLDSMDRFFPLAESAATPPTEARAETTGQATSSHSEQSYGVTQQMEVILLKHLALRAGAELRNGSHGFTPNVQGKYQFLRQNEQRLNASAGLRYKQAGFLPDGGEVEAFVAVGRRFGKLLATGNVVVGREVSRGGMDLEGHLGVGYLLTDSLMVGANARIQQEVMDAELIKPTGREFELLSGGVVGYAWSGADLSLMGGWYMPRASNNSGPLVMLRLGLNF